MLTMANRKEDLDTCGRRQGAEDLAAVLLELAQANPQVRQRLVLMQLSDKPDRLAATFQKTLNGRRRQSRFLDYRASQEWAAGHGDLRLQADAAGVFDAEARRSGSCAGNLGCGFAMNPTNRLAMCFMVQPIGLAACVKRSS